MHSNVQLLILITSLSLISCGSNSNQVEFRENQQRPTSNKSTQPSPTPTQARLSKTWKLKYVTQCKETPAEECVGKYGFIAKSDGTFQIGPGPDGQIIQGELTADEISQIQKQLSRIQPTSSPQSRTSPRPSLDRDPNSGPDPSPSSNPSPSVDLNPGPSANPSPRPSGRLNPPSSERCIFEVTSPQESTVELNYQNSQPIRITHGSDQFCYRSVSESLAHEIDSFVSELITKYHPSRFPNECINACKALHDFYQTLRKCEKDSDCAYIGDDFLPLRPGEFPDLVIDDCSYIQPLLYADHFSAVSNQLDLILLHDVAIQACRQDEKRSGCQKVKKLNPSQSLLSCIKGKCITHPFKSRNL